MTTGHKHTKRRGTDTFKMTGFSMEVFMLGMKRLSVALRGRGGGPVIMDCSVNHFEHAIPFVAPAIEAHISKSEEIIKRVIKDSMKKVEFRPYNYIFRYDHESIDSFMYRYECAKAAYEESQTEENDMAMSKDRVKFSIPACRLVQTVEGTRYREVLCKTMGLDSGVLCREVANAELGDSGRVFFVCRPSQFSRFLIARNDACISNSFKELNPELFTPLPKPSAIDCSGNPARQC